ncbi:MAG: hypothetical protein HDT26_03750 [Subdoligranulum sp.]|nr:hypothetical protein [Subdoligranulum sp.]
MENIIFSRPQGATQRSYAANRTATEQVRQTADAQTQTAKPESTESGAEGVFAANKLAAAQLARQRAISAFDEAAKNAVPGAAASKANLTEQLRNAVQAANSTAAFPNADAPSNAAGQREGAPAQVAHTAGQPTYLAAQMANALGQQLAGAAAQMVNAMAQSAGAAAQMDGAGAVSLAPPQSDTVETMKSMLSQANDEAKSLMDMMEEARKKAQETREKLKLPKNSARYGYAAIEAFARLSRARSQAQVSSAAGYARRQLGQMQSALRQDPDNAGRIRAAIRQLQSAVTRASRKKRELEQDRVDNIRRARAEKQHNKGKARRIENELRRKQAVRKICDNGYVNNAVIDMVQQEHIEQARALQKEQLERIAGLGGNSYTDAAGAAYSVASTEAAQAAYAAGASYAAGAAPAAAPAAAAMPEIQLEG